MAQYNGIMLKLQEITKKYPEVSNFLKYWDLHKSHVFAPFPGGGLAGCNLSEQGNVSFKPASTIGLVHATKYDVASMILQESQINLFEQNLLKCASKGPTKQVRDMKDRAQQVKAAEDFANIFDNEEDVFIEGHKGMNPSSYLPKKGTQRPPRARATGQKKAQRKKPKKAVDEGLLWKNCILAMEILDCNLVAEATINTIKNPPFIIEVMWQMHKCRGCKKEITDEDKAYPHSMVLRRIGVIGYLNKVLNKWVQSEQNVHFHMDVACLHRHEATMEACYITCSDEYFAGLDRAQMEYLMGIGFLKPIARKKVSN